MPVSHQPLEGVFAEPDPPQAQILALSSFFYHLQLLRRVWLCHLGKCPSGSGKLLFKCTLVFSLLDKKPQLCQFPQPPLTNPKTSAVGQQNSCDLQPFRKTLFSFPVSFCPSFWGEPKTGTPFSRCSPAGQGGGGQ